MIDIDKTFYETLKRNIRELVKHGKTDSFKEIMYAVILWDLKDWSMYYPNEEYRVQLQLILDDYILEHKTFLVFRRRNDGATWDTLNYYNTNTPLTNTTWTRIYDKENFVRVTNVTKNTPTSECTSWEVDPTCTPQIVYLDGKPEDILDKAKLTICEKMNAYIDRTTGKVWYLDTDCKWVEVKSAGCTEEEVLDLIKNNRGKVNRTWDSTDISLNIEDTGINTLEITNNTEDNIDDVL